MRAVQFFRPIPVVVPPGLTADERLLAAWAGRPDPEPDGRILTVREARLRLIRLRRERGIGPDGRVA